MGCQVHRGTLWLKCYQSNNLLQTAILRPGVFENNYDWKGDSFWTIEHIWLKALCIDSGLPCIVSRSHKKVVCVSVAESEISAHNFLLVIIHSTVYSMWGKALIRTGKFRYINQSIQGNESGNETPDDCQTSQEEQCGWSWNSRSDVHPCEATGAVIWVWPSSLHGLGEGLRPHPPRSSVRGTRAVVTNYPVLV